MTGQATAAPSGVSRWCVPDTIPALERSDVQVWCVRTDQGDETLRRMSASLTERERHRMTQMKHAYRGERFIVRRAALRALLGATLGVPPHDVPLAADARGRLQVTGVPALAFSVSHSGPLALLALGWGRRLGVDVEQWMPRADPTAIVERVFSPRERAAFLALPAKDRPVSFYRGWTRKEAVAKALGGGVAATFTHFAVSLAPTASSGVLQMDLPHETAAQWQVLDLSPADGFFASLAVDTTDRVGLSLFAMPIE